MDPSDAWPLLSGQSLSFAAPSPPGSAGLGTQQTFTRTHGRLPLAPWSLAHKVAKIAPHVFLMITHFKYF